MLRLYEDRREPRLREAREWFSVNFTQKRGGLDAYLSSRKPGKHIHAHGARLLGNGGEHRKPRPYRRRLFLRKHRGAMGRLGTSEAGDRGVARDVQQPEVPKQPRTALQSPRILAREAQPWSNAAIRKVLAQMQQATQALKAQAAGG